MPDQPVSAGAERPAARALATGGAAAGSTISFSRSERNRSTTSSSSRRNDQYTNENNTLRERPATAADPTHQLTATRKRRIRVSGTHTLPPLEVEQLRDQVPTDQDALLISLLAYAGLRPQEALALTWSDIRDNTIIIDKAVTHGVLKSTKTNKNRWVALLTPLADDLNSYRKTLKPTPGPGALVFPHPDNPADHWGDTTYRNWRDRTFTPAADRAGLTATPYTLRHSFISLLLAAGQRRTEVAEQAGHSLTVMENTYAHIIEEYRGTTLTDPGQAILTARTQAAQLRDAASQQPASNSPPTRGNFKAPQPDDTRSEQHRPRNGVSSVCHP